MQLPKHIFLFGHRKQHGKDSTCDELEVLLQDMQIPYHRSFFAKLLKKQVCEKFALDYDRMNDESYKNSIPEHIPPMESWLNPKTNEIEYNKRLTVREILVEDGTRHARKIWNSVWSFACYNEILNSGAEIGMISDFRFPGEYDDKDIIFKAFCEKNQLDINTIELPTVHKILVHREDGMFITDGADDQLPDPETIDDELVIPEFWDYVIFNDDKTPNWKLRLREQMNNILQTLGIGEYASIREIKQG